MHTRRTRRNWDAFLSYAGEDKTDVVQPLTTMLSDGALKIWVGYRELRIGDSLVGRISEGLRHSRYGIVVLSPSFFKKPWPKTELDAILPLINPTVVSSSPCGIA